MGGTRPPKVEGVFYMQEMLPKFLAATSPRGSISCEVGTLVSLGEIDEGADM